jgi:anti-sigma B factor antagonist
MSVNISTLEGGINLLEVRGSLLGGREIDEFRRRISELIDREADKLIVDLSKVSFLNSSAVGVLVSAFISYSRRNWQIRFCGENKVVYTILRITKLNLALTYHDTVNEAIRSFT